MCQSREMVEIYAVWRKKIERTSPSSILLELNGSQ